MISNTDDSITQLIDQLEAELPDLVHDLWGQGNIDQITDYVPDSADIVLFLTPDNKDILSVELTFDFIYKESADDYKKELELGTNPIVVYINERGKLDLDRKEIQACVEAKI